MRNSGQHARPAIGRQCADHAGEKGTAPGLADDDGPSWDFPAWMWSKL